MIREIEFQSDVPTKLQYCSIAVGLLGAAVVGGVSTAYAANKAAEAQTNAANQAAQTSMAMYQTTRGDLAPYRDIGQQAGTTLMGKLGDLTAPIVMDQAALEQTPGYQFTKTQGLKGVQNAAAARGLGASGAALKGAAAFSTGLADTTYQTQFNLENINRTNAYNRLYGLTALGETAATGTGTAGTAAADTTAKAQMAAGNAQAAGYNAIGSAVTGAGNTIGGYLAYKGLYGGTGNTPEYNPNTPAEGVGQYS